MRGLNDKVASLAIAFINSLISPRVSLVTLRIGPMITEVIGEIDMNCSSKIGFEVVKLAFGHFTSKTQTSPRISNDSPRKTS